MRKDTSKMTNAEREAYWQAQSDASALKRYSEVCSDEKRLKAANEILQEEQAQIQAALATQHMNALIRGKALQNQT